MWDAFLRPDMRTALSYFDPDVEWDGTNLPDGQIERGREAIMGHFRRWANQWDGWTVEVERIIDADSDQVVVVFRERGRSKTGLEMNECHAELYRLRDGKVVRRQGFSDPNEALKSAGLNQ